MFFCPLSKSFVFCTFCPFPTFWYKSRPEPISHVSIPLFAGSFCLFTQHATHTHKHTNHVYMKGNQDFIRTTHPAFQGSSTLEWLQKNSFTFQLMVLSKHTNYRAAEWCNRNVFALLSQEHENPDNALPSCSPLVPASALSSQTAPWTQPFLQTALGPGLKQDLAPPPIWQQCWPSGAIVIPKNISLFLAEISTRVASSISTQFMVPVLMMSELLLLASTNCSNCFHCNVASSSSPTYLYCILYDQILVLSYYHISGSVYFCIFSCSKLVLSLTVLYYFTAAPFSSQAADGAFILVHTPSSTYVYLPADN